MVQLLQVATQPLHPDSGKLSLQHYGATSMLPFRALAISSVDVRNVLLAEGSGPPALLPLMVSSLLLLSYL